MKKKTIFGTEVTEELVALTKEFFSNGIERSLVIDALQTESSDAFLRKVKRVAGRPLTEKEQALAESLSRRYWAAKVCLCASPRQMWGKPFRENGSPIVGYYDIPLELSRYDYGVLISSDRAEEGLEPVSWYGVSRTGYGSCCNKYYKKLVL